jgi:hypothetical protein
MQRAFRFGKSDKTCCASDDPMSGIGQTAGTILNAFQVVPEWAITPDIVTGPQTLPQENQLVGDSRCFPRLYSPDPGISSPTAAAAWLWFPYSAT